jgi:hypothetical protein
MECGIFAESRGREGRNTNQNKNSLISTQVCGGQVDATTTTTTAVSLGYRYHMVNATVPVSQHPEEMVENRRVDEREKTTVLLGRVPPAARD